MKHLDEGALRRLYDDPLVLSDPDREHFRGCEQCRERFVAIAAETREVAGLMAVGAAPVGIPALDLGASHPSVTAPRRHLPTRWGGGFLSRPLVAVAAAVAAVAVLGVTGVAQSIFTVMEPTRVAVVPVTSSELQALPDLTHFGTVAWAGQPSLKQTAGAEAAAAGAGFAAPQAGSLPSGLGAPQYGYLGQSQGTFTFSAALAREWASQHGSQLPAMPGGIDGSSLTLTTGPAIVEAFGMAPGHATEMRGDMLAIGKMKAPTVQSTGPSVKEIEDYLLSMPGISPDLAAAIRAIGDPTTTLPLPVPVDRATTQPVNINGVQGVLVGDNTGLGAGVIWIKNGFVYGVGGTLTQDQVLAIARSVS